MTDVPYKVYVVMAQDFGERLAGLSSGVPVWIVDTPINRPVAERMWKEHPSESHLTSITAFKAQGSSSAEDLFLNEMNTIDLHHGSYSSNPPYTALEVIGMPLSDRLRTELAEYGFNEFRPKSDGFVAIRPLPCD